MRWHLFIGAALFISCSNNTEQSDDAPQAENADLSLVVNAGDSSFNRVADTLFYSGELFTGVKEEFYPTGTIHMREEYVNGKKHGMCLSYYQSGSVRFKRPYLKGEKHGKHLGYYESGARKYRYYFEHGFSEGHHQEWYESGQLYRDLNYEEGRERGPQKMYRPDGKLRGNYVVRENGRIYGLVGVKRCKNIDTENESLDELKPN